jgi:DNA-binding GntR family transcriptional regulator
VTAQDPRKYVQVAAALRAKISDGTLKPGDVVLIPDLVHEHHCSRQTAGKALRILVTGGQLERYPGLGYYVVDPTDAA